MADLIDRDSLLLKQKAHAELFADSTVHDDIVRRDEATAALAEIINAPSVNRWISVEDALPDAFIYVICVGKDGMAILRYNGEVWVDDAGCIYPMSAITHWMPLPEPPEKIGDDESKKQIADAPIVDASQNVYASLEPFGDTGSAYHDRWICTNCHRTCRSESWGTKCDYERCPHCGAIICGGEK